MSAQGQSRERGWFGTHKVTQVLRRLTVLRRSETPLRCDDYRESEAQIAERRQRARARAEQAQWKPPAWWDHL